MNVESVIKDIKRMEGVRLNSIRPGAEITLLEVDEARERILVLAKDGKLKSRPFTEMRAILRGLNSLPAIRVDETLHGSGTSRNQPETIFANLPYVEWFKFEGKKHISFVNGETHPIGTLKQMDEVSAERIRKKLRDDDLNSITSIVVGDDICTLINSYERIVGVEPQAVCQDAYVVRRANSAILFVREGSFDNYVGLSGTYVVINSNKSGVSSPHVEICGKKFIIASDGDLKILSLLR